MCREPITVPELPWPTEDDLVRIAETDAGSRSGQDTKATPGRSGADMIGFNDDDVAPRARQFNRRDDTGDAGANDDGICRVGKRPGDRVVEVFPPTGEGVRQSFSLGV